MTCEEPSEVRPNEIYSPYHPNYHDVEDRFILLLESAAKGLIVRYLQVYLQDPEYDGTPCWKSLVQREPRLEVKLRKARSRILHCRLQNPLLNETDRAPLIRDVYHLLLWYSAEGKALHFFKWYFCDAEYDGASCWEKVVSGEPHLKIRKFRAKKFLAVAVKSLSQRKEDPDSKKSEEGLELEDLLQSDCAKDSTDAPVCVNETNHQDEHHNILSQVSGPSKETHALVPISTTAVDNEHMRGLFAEPVQADFRCMEDSSFHTAASPELGNDIATREGTCESKGEEAREDEESVLEPALVYGCQKDDNRDIEEDGDEDEGFQKNSPLKRTARDEPESASEYDSYLEESGDEVSHKKINDSIHQNSRLPGQSSTFTQALQDRLTQHLDMAQSVEHNDEPEDDSSSEETSVFDSPEEPDVSYESTKENRPPTAAPKHQEASQPDLPAADGVCPSSARQRMSIRDTGSSNTHMTKHLETHHSALPIKLQTPTLAKIGKENQSKRPLSSPPPATENQKRCRLVKQTSTTRYKDVGVQTEPDDSVVKVLRVDLEVKRGSLYEWLRSGE